MMGLRASKNSSMARQNGVNRTRHFFHNMWKSRRSLIEYAVTGFLAVPPMNPISNSRTESALHAQNLTVILFRPARDVIST